MLVKVMSNSISVHPHILTQEARVHGDRAEVSKSVRDGSVRIFSTMWQASSAGPSSTTGPASAASSSSRAGPGPRSPSSAATATSSRVKIAEVKNLLKNPKLRRVLREELQEVLGWRRSQHIAFSCPGAG